MHQEEPSSASKIVRSHIGSERPEPGPYKCMLTLTSKTRLKPWGGPGWKLGEWVDWEAQRGQYLKGWVCCATLKDAFWGHAWLPRTNPWGGPGWKPWTWVDWEAQSGQYLASEVGCYKDSQNCSSTNTWTVTVQLLLSRFWTVILRPLLRINYIWSYRTTIQARFVSLES
jgi:hypothetical protein